VESHRSTDLPNNLRVKTVANEEAPQSLSGGE
jgi:hypothetical protein